MGRCSSFLLAAGRAELRRTQFTRSSRRNIEGAAGCCLTTQCYGAQLRWKGWPSIYLDPQPTLSTFQVGRNWRGNGRICTLAHRKFGICKLSTFSEILDKIFFFVSIHHYSNLGQTMCKFGICIKFAYCKFISEVAGSSFS